MSIKKTTDKECLEAIDYFINMDMINNRMNSDERHYCAILIKRVVETLEVTNGK